MNNNNNISNAGDNAIYEYYALKAKYDNTVNKSIKQIRDQDLSKKQKRRKFQQLKHKCIKCKRNVNTTFSNKNGKLIAVCGDSLNPCELDINIELSQTMQVKEILTKFNHNKSLNQENIIKNKFDLLFGYINEDDALERFNELMVDTKELNNSISVIKQAYKEENDEEKIESEIEELKKQYYEKINQIKEHILKYKDSNNYQFIIDLISIYQDELQPIIIELRNKKYADTIVTLEDNNFNLIQTPFNLINPTIVIKESKVISNKK